MSSETRSKTMTVALLGNPNTGKSTLFSALAGVRQQTGNYPGVTVEKKVGVLKIGAKRIELVDLPGTYSLAPRSLDEMVTVDVLLGRLPGTHRPDAILCILDASNLQRNLYLLSQALELNLPTIVALNMHDVAQKRGVAIAVEKLEHNLGVPVVVTQANRGIGVEALKEKLATCESLPLPNIPSPFAPAFLDEVNALHELLIEKKIGATEANAGKVSRYLVERLLLDTTDYIERELFADRTPEDLAQVRETIAAARDRLKRAGSPVPAIEAMARYTWVGQVLSGVVETQPNLSLRPNDRVDRVLTHKIWGTFIFIAMMTLVFRAVFAWATPLMEGIEASFGWLGEWVSARMTEGPLQSLIVDGIITGVGGVLVFLPQILILFLFIAVLEDCGYIARAAYLMDKIMSRFGLSGKSFIPLLSSFACAIPGIMATRVIENRRDRFVTILIAPLMSCSARLPVYVLLISAFVPNRQYLGGLVGLQSLTMVAMYAIGVVTAAAVALLLRWTVLPGETPPFVLELPSYKWPSAKVVALRLWDSGYAFVKRAGTLILAVTILVWAAAYFPRIPSNDTNATATNQTAESENETAGNQIRQSYLGRAGKSLEPAVRPLGWDWRVGCAVLASFPAREVVVGTLGVIYNLGDEEDETSVPLKEQLQTATWDGTDKPVYTLPVAFSIMVFFALCAQCGATLVVIKRETNSWRWPIFAFVYMTSLAYIGALITYQVGTYWF